MGKNINTCRRYDADQGSLRVARYFENHPGSDISNKKSQENPIIKSSRSFGELQKAAEK